MTGTRKPSWTKWLVILLVLGGAVAGGIVYVIKRPREIPLDFKTASATRGDLTQQVTANGQITPVKNVQVGSEVSGKIMDIRVDFNSKVKAGEIIAQIDSSTYQQSLTQADADLMNAKASLELAQLNARRADELRKNELISQADADAAIASLHQAEAVVKTREASVQKAKVDLERTTIYAPISGMVISRNVDVGQTVASSFSTPTLFLIANDLAKMQIETMVSEADVGGVAEGQKVTFQVDAFPNRQFQGRVNQVRFAPITNQNVVNYTTVVEVNNADLKLRPGMTANVSIITSQRTNVLKVPNAALRFRLPDNAVIGSTNDVVAKAAGTNSAGMRAPGDMPMPPWVAERRRPTEEERKKFEDSLTPEQKEQYRQMRERVRAATAEGGGPPGEGGGRGGGGSGGMFGAGNRSGTGDGPAIRTVYVLDPEKSAPGKPVLQAVSIKTGISDGTNTEVQEGLKDNDVLVIGLKSAATAATAPVTANPFGGPFGGGRPR